MALFVMVTRLAPEAVSDTDSHQALESRVAETIARDCPEVRWRQNLAVLGPYDYLDIFEAPDSDEAMKVAAIVRAHGHGEVEVWPAQEWKRFKELMAGLE